MQQDMAIDEWCMVYQSEVGSLYKYIVHLFVGLIIMYTTDYLHVYHWLMIAYILCNFGSIKGLDFYIYIYVYYIFELTCHSLLYLYSEFWIFSVDRGTVYDVALWLCMEEITMRIWWVPYILSTSDHCWWVVPPAHTVSLIWKIIEDNSFGRSIFDRLQQNPLICS